MRNQALETVEEMFKAFESRDIEKLKTTVSDDTVWTYHGTHKIPKNTFEGKEGVARFFGKIFATTEVLKFEPQQFVSEGNTVVVIGEEHQRVKRTGAELKQRWVQIYNVMNSVITRMEEFAVSE